MRASFVSLWIVCVWLLIILTTCSAANPLIGPGKSLRRQSIDRLRSIFPRTKQYTNEKCTDDSDCEEPRKCRNERFELCGESEKDCECKVDGPTTCTNTSQCLDGDLCYKRGDAKEGSCYTCKTRAENEENGLVTDGNIECVCISVDLLKAFETSSLVFSSHRRASVLCDQFQNCATPGHIVLFKSYPMSMATYCSQDSVSCTRRVKLVNSPRMKIGLRVPSFSKHLQFTALAAAKETLIEEAFLKLAVSMGV